MADDARPPRADLGAGDDTARLPDGLDPAEVGFFQLLRLLEEDGKRFGRSGGPEKEPARLGQAVRLSFATRDVEGIAETGDGDTPRVDVHVLGLLGPEGPMPLHLTRWVMTRLSNRWFAGDKAGATSDTAFLDFCNLLSHRMIALYWRAWAEARPEVQLEHDTGGRIAALMRTLGGVGLPGGARASDHRDGYELRHGTSLVSDVRGVERLTRYLSDVIEAPVELREYRASWTEIPAHLQTRLGQAHAGLGTGAVAGRRSFSRHDRAELVVGPLPFDRFVAFLDDPTAMADLRGALLFAMGCEIDFDLRLVLAAPEVPEARLGHARLGRTTWLNPAPGRDADDLCLYKVSAPMEAAA